VQAVCGVFERMFGPDQVIGRELYELMPERFQEDHKRGLRQWINGGEPHHVGKDAIRLRALNSKGKEFPISLSLDEAEAKHCFGWVEKRRMFPKWLFSLSSLAWLLMIAALIFMTPKVFQINQNELVVAQLQKEVERQQGMLSATLITISDLQQIEVHILKLNKDIKDQALSQDAIFLELKKLSSRITATRISLQAVLETISNKIEAAER